MTRAWVSLVGASLVVLAHAASAETLTIATGSSGKALDVLRQELAAFTQQTGIDVQVMSTANSPLGTFGQMQRWLAGHNEAIDVYDVNLTWAPQMARNFVDLSATTADIANTEIPALVHAATVGTDLPALPYYADLPALFYRTDLVAKYKVVVPGTWEQLGNVATTVMNGERAAGDSQMWGYVFPGAATEDLTANVLEWIASNEGGHIVEDDGTISVDNVKAILAVETAEKWIGTITPPQAVDFAQADARKLWLSGEAAFTRDWHDALGQANAAGSPIAGKVGVAELMIGSYGQRPAETIDGFSLAVSLFSQNQDDAVRLVRFLASADAQKTYQVGMLGRLPAIAALYDDPAVAKAEPEIATYKSFLPDIVQRPAEQTGVAYSRVSSDFAVAMNCTLKHEAFAEDFIQSYRHDLEHMQAAGWSPNTPRGQVGDTAP